MNWEALGAVGEFLSAVAVLVTLIYLAVQVRQVKKDIHVSSYREVNKFFESVSTSVTNSPELAKVIAKKARNENLEDWEQVILDEHYFLLMTTMEVAWQHLKAKALVDVGEDDAKGTIRSYLNRPGMKDWWVKNRNSYLSDWRELVDSMIEGIGT